MAVLSMSKQEFSRLDVLLRVQSGSLRVGDACVLIGLQRRQVVRLLRGLKQDGSASLLSKLPISECRTALLYPWGSSRSRLPPGQS